jgi:phosphate transport system permease protein
MKQILTIASIISSSTVVLIFLFLIYFSIPLFQGVDIRTLFSDEWLPEQNIYGLLPMVIGSLVIAINATVLASLYALSIAFCIDGLKNKKLQSIFYYFFNIVSSIPTVVYGFLGVIILVPFIRVIYDNSGMNILSASLMLSLVITPTITLFFIDTIKSTPKEYQNILYSLGGTKIQYQLYILLSYHKRTLMLGIIMGFCRAIGDTMIALMLAGNSIIIPTNLQDSARTLTSHIALLFAGDFDSLEFQSIFASGLLLFIITIVLLSIIKVVRHAKNH